jgi:hypothetical protein
MLRDPSEVEEGQVVWLYPQTKQASTNCHKQLRVKIAKKPTAHWPMLVVVWTLADGTDSWELVHRDNIRKKPPGGATVSAEKKQGDTVGDGGSMARWKPKVMPGRKPVDIEGQETLF